LSRPRRERGYVLRLGSIDLDRQVSDQPVPGAFSLLTGLGAPFVFRALLTDITPSGRLPPAGTAADSKPPDGSPQDKEAVQINDLTEIGPVQLMQVGFNPGANFEGRIADELARLEKERTIRVLDLLFVAKDTDSGELMVLEHQEEKMGAIVGALLGLKLDDDSSDAAAEGWARRFPRAARRPSC
jgi:hypothetical protein